MNPNDLPEKENLSEASTQPQQNRDTVNSYLYIPRKDTSSEESDFQEHPEDPLVTISQLEQGLNQSHLKPLITEKFPDWKKYWEGSKTL